MNASVLTRKARTAVGLTELNAHEVLSFSLMLTMPIALGEDACEEGVVNSDQLLAGTIALRKLYKKHHWQVSAQRSTSSIYSSTGTLENGES